MLPVARLMLVVGRRNAVPLDMGGKKLYGTPVQKGVVMTIQTTYTQARAQLATLLEEVTHNREIVIIQRRGEEDVALIAADELAGLMETVHLLRSPANADRLLGTLARVRQRLGTAQTIDQFRHEVQLDATE